MGLFGRVTRLAAHLSEAQAPVFQNHGLTAAGFDVLATLRRAGPPYALTPSALIAWTMVTSGTMTNRLDRLERDRLIERQPNPKDGRGWLVALTPEGFARIDRVVTEHVANQHRLLDGLSPAQRESLNAGLAAWLTLYEARDDPAES